MALNAAGNKVVRSLCLITATPFKVKESDGRPAVAELSQPWAKLIQLDDVCVCTSDPGFFEPARGKNRTLLRLSFKGSPTDKIGKNDG